MSPLIRSEVNGFQTFLIGPDGSKEDWPDSLEYDAKRRLFVEDMKHMPSIELVELRYGDGLKEEPSGEFRHCPDCATMTLRKIETIDNGDEWKLVFTCDQCELILYIFEKKVI